MKIAIDALSARGGGGMVYLTQLLAHLREVAPEDEFYIFASPEAASSLLSFQDPRFHVVKVELSSTWRRLLYEQTLLPLALRRRSVDVVYAQWWWASRTRTSTSPTRFPGP
jgi:hypothetical protein